MNIHISIRPRWPVIALALMALALAACSGSGSPTTSAPAGPALAAASGTNGDAGSVSDGRGTSAAPAGPAPVATVTLAQDYENAAGIRTQLLIGTLRLEETALAVAPEQAAALLPLWKMLRTLTGSGLAAEAEVEAVIAQIQGTMTGEQLAAITAMRLTNEDVQATMQSLGVAPPAGAGPGSGGGPGMSPEARATRRAEMGVSRESGGASALMERVIELLESKLG